MKYSVLILRRAQKELASLPPEVYERVKEAIWALGENVRPFGIKKLKNIEVWRIRVGNYRIIYEIDDINRTVTILHVGHRKDVYSF